MLDMMLPFWISGRGMNENTRSIPQSNVYRAVQLPLRCWLR